MGNITRLALLRCECEIEFNKEVNIGRLTNVIAEIEKSRMQLGRIGYKIGEERAKIYVDCLKNKIEGQELGNFRKTLKTKSIRVKVFNNTKSVGTLLNSEILQDEDVKLFVEVIENPDPPRPLELNLPDQKLMPRTPEVQSIRKKQFEEQREKLTKRTEADEESKIEFKSGFKEKRKRINSMNSQKKFIPGRKGNKEKSKKRPQNTEPLDLGRIPSIIAHGGND